MEDGHIQRSSQERNAMAMSNAARVLIAEDERLVARNLERQLRRQGHMVVGLVSTGPEAIQQALQYRPDMILMDIRLRGQMDGIEAAAAIRKDLNVRIAYMSAYIDEATVARAQATQPDAFLHKPFSSSSFLEMLQQILP
jgi:two-component system, cell cycle sensor histidine kinase and response regulator CckA